MEWYDKISKFYDIACGPIYKNSRKKLIDELDLFEGDKVLLIACGTGLSFNMIIDKIGSNGLIVGVDTSIEMIKIAEKKAKDNGWNNVKLIQMKAEELSNEIIEQKLKEEVKFDKVIAELAFSVIPNWKLAADNSIKLLKLGGKIGVLDYYIGDNNFISKSINYFANSDVSRNVSKYLRKITKNYQIKHLLLKESLFIAIGEKTNSIINVKK